MAMEYTWSGGSRGVGVDSILFLRISQEHFSSSQRTYAEMKPVIALLLWLYFTGAAIFIGGEINSEIEKAAADAGSPDVRRPGEPRSGGSLMVTSLGARPSQVTSSRANDGIPSLHRRAKTAQGEQSIRFPSCNLRCKRKRDWYVTFVALLYYSPS
jgi:hypothetical protein